MKETDINKWTTLLFDRIETYNEKRECYERMLKDGISKKKACQYLGVDIHEFDC